MSDTSRPLAYASPLWPGHPPRLNRTAIVSLTVSATGLALAYAVNILVGAPVGATGAILGHIATRRIRRGAGAGRFIALAGTVLGWLPAVVLLVVLGVYIWAVHGND